MTRHPNLPVSPARLDDAADPSLPTSLSLNRRGFLAAGLATSASLASGCASIGGQTGAARVVIVGGGWGGASTARALTQSPIKLDITMIEAHASFMSCPLSVHYIAGYTPASAYQRSYQRLDQAGVKRLQTRVTGIDRASKKVITEQGAVPYDFLVLSPGVDYMEDSLPGYAQARELLPVGFRAFEQMAVRQQLDAFLQTGGTAVVTVPKPPYRCPPAPYERAAMIAEQIKRRKLKAKVIVVDASPSPLPTPIAAPILNTFKTLYKDQIEYQAQTELQGVDARAKLLQTTMGDIPYQFANLILPMQAPKLVRDAGLGGRWADVKLPSFVSAADPAIHVIGDAAGTPLPKSGHVAFETGQRVAQQIIAQVQGKPAQAPAGVATLPNGICWAAMSEHTGIGIHASGSIEPGSPPKLAFKVDPAPSEDAARGAKQWAESVWDAMLG